MQVGADAPPYLTTRLDCSRPAPYVSRLGPLTSQGGRDHPRSAARDVGRRYAQIEPTGYIFESKLALTVSYSWVVMAPESSSFLSDVNCCTSSPLG